MRLSVDAHGPIPVRSQLTDQLKHVIEGGGLPRSPARPSIRALADSPGGDPSPVTRAIEDLKRSGYRPLRSCPGAP
jgi:DNA-binding transcriptional regulator YhcF (GntR family)